MTGNLVSRRRFLQGALATTGMAVATVGLGEGTARALAGTPGKRVAVLGGGVAGLSAAHELVERGFAVTVYERKPYLGGKAYSFAVPGTGVGGRAGWPAEHGFRFFPGFYKNLGDTMRRTPISGGTAYDRLVRASTYLSARDDNRPNATVPLSLPAFATPTEFTNTLSAALTESGAIPAWQVGYFASRLLVYVTSCAARRFGEWEDVNWTDFTYANDMSPEYTALLTRGLTRNLAAEQAGSASANSIGWVGEATVYSAAGAGNDQNATVDRVLDGPSSTVWLDPWVAYLRKLGVEFRTGSAVQSLQLDGHRITSATVTGPTGSTEAVSADWFISAMPVERAVRLLSDQVLSAAPQLAGMFKLQTSWMNGLQLYLKDKTPITNGHVNYIDSPWAITSISQAQFWSGSFPQQYGDGTAAESLSTIISDWTTPGVLYGKAAQDCTPTQIAAEVWAQLKAHLNKTNQTVLTDDMLRSWSLDPAIVAPGTSRVANDTPLFIQNTGSWNDRPDSATGIGNFFLAGDYIRTNMMVTTMESANESGRQAVNALLAAASSNEPRCQLWNLYTPPEWEPFRATDELRYQAGLPNAFDQPPPKQP